MQVARVRRLSRLGALCGVLAFIPFIVGCPPPTPPPPCETAADCDDDDVCTTDTCVDGVCVNTSIADCCRDTEDCELGEVCSNNVCVEACTTAADCPDDGNQCTAATCTNGQCGTANLANGTACDDGSACTTNDACANGVCTGTAVDCSDGDNCTQDVCNPATGVCSNPPVVCPEGQVCDSATGACVEEPCDVDADCDDGNVCTTDTCENELCVRTPIPGCCTTDAQCAAGQTCNTDTNLCQTPGTTFNLTTDDDAITGTTGDDIFNASIGTLNPGDIVVGNGGNDTMNAVVAGNTSSGATLIDIDAVNFTTLNATTFNAENTAAIGQFNAASGSTGALSLQNLEEGTNVGMGAGYNRRMTVNQTTAADLNELTLFLNGTANGAIFDYDRNAANLDTLNVDVAGDNLLSPAGSYFGDVDNVNIIGGSSLNLQGMTAAFLAAHVWETEDYNGDLIVSGLAGTLDFAANGLNDVDMVVVTDEVAGAAGVYTFAADNGPVTIEVASLDEDETLNTLAATYGGTVNTVGNVTLMLGGDGDGTGAFTGTNVGTLNVVSGGSSENAVNGGSIGSNGFGLGAVQKRVNVSGDQDLDLGEFTADIIDANAMTGGLTVRGGGNTMQIIGGAGDDVLNGGTGQVFLTGNGGVNTFRFDNSVASGSPASADRVLDWTDGSDLVGISAGATFGAGGNVGLAQGGGAAGSLAATAAGSVVVTTVAQNAAAAAIGTTQFIKLTTGVAQGASDQATFDAAIGTATLTGLTADTAYVGSYFDTTNNQAVIFEVLSTATTNTVIETGDVIRVIARIDMSAQNYTDFTAADLVIYTP